MDSRDIDLLIEKYLKGECTEEERNLLEMFLDTYQIGDNQLSENDFVENIMPDIWQNIEAKSELKPRKRKGKLVAFNLSNVVKLAAVLTLITLSVGLLRNFTNQTAEELVIPNDQITLKTGDGKVDKIEVGQFSTIKNDEGEDIATHKGDVIVYEASDEIEELVYNEIEVPRGKKIKLLLSDGTLVHINSKSTFKFPVKFLKGAERKVFLTGEAYFEVAKDESRQFQVVTGDIGVNVYGTHFNINSYPGSLSQTVLMEGSVAVQLIEGGSVNQEELILIPGQKATNINGVFETEEVDVEDYLGWTNDWLIFNDEAFKEIIKKIERHYNVDINNSYKDLASVRFNGKFKEETVIDLLETFKESAGFTYNIEDNKVIINQN